MKIGRTAKDRVRLRCAGMALASMQGRSVPQIAVMFRAKEQTVRELIKTFNERGSRHWTQSTPWVEAEDRPSGA